MFCSVQTTRPHYSDSSARGQTQQLWSFQDQFVFPRSEGEQGPVLKGLLILEVYQVQEEHIFLSV